MCTQLLRCYMPPNAEEALLADLAGAVVLHGFGTSSVRLAADDLASIPGRSVGMFQSIQK